MNLIPARLSREEEGCVRIRGKENGFEIRLSGEKAKKIDSGYQDGDVVFGIRPPDFVLGTAGAANGTHVKAGVLSYEAGCEHAYLEVKVGATPVLVECPPDRRFSEGDSISLDLAAKRFQVFDEVTGKSITKDGYR
jgi:ABC-type sugar transport system ATPase subunit